MSYRTKLEAKKQLVDELFKLIKTTSEGKEIVDMKLDKSMAYVVIQYTQGYYIVVDIVAEDGLIMLKNIFKSI